MLFRQGVSGWRWSANWICCMVFLFPYIRQMVKAKSQGKELDGINRLESLLGELDEEHQTNVDLV